MRSLFKLWLWKHLKDAYTDEKCGCVQGGIVVLVGIAGGILPVPIGTTIMNQISVVGTYVGDKPMVGEVLQLMAEKKV